MPLARFLTPISDSGIYFEFELLEVSQRNRTISFNYALGNINDFAVKIPITITQAGFRNLGDTGDSGPPDKKACVFADHVVDLATRSKMYGYGNDHHVSFMPGERKQFLVLFKPHDIDATSIDLEFFMKPDDGVYGRYRLRYSFASNSIVGRYCDRTYPNRT